MSKKIYSLLLVIFLLLEMVNLVQAQQDDYRLNVHRNFGYSSGSQIRGSFSLDVVGPQNIAAITYLIDGEVMARVTTSPFNLQFQTTQYINGWHTLSAVVETTDGKQVTTPSRRFEFATSEQETSTVTSLIIPIFGSVLLLIVLIVGFQMFLLKGKSNSKLPLGTPRKYGILGGSVCPHCHRAFPLHWWAPNIGFRTRFDRCEFCGKWSIFKILSQNELLAAEAAELQQAQSSAPRPNMSEEDRLKEMVEKSRYTNQS